MSVIAAYYSEGEDSIYVGHDTQHFSNGKTIITLNSKIKEMKDNQGNIKHMVGVTGSSDIQTLFFGNTAVNIPIFNHMKEVWSWFNGEFKGYFTPDNSDWNILLITLLGGKRRIIHIDSGYFCVEPLDPYYAIGSGSAFAMGALSTYNNTQIHGRERVEQAVQAAIKHSLHCSGDVKLYEF